MKNFGFIILLCISFFACNKKEKQYEIKDLSGEWVNTKYLNAVRKTKSAKISQDACIHSFIRFTNDTALFVYSLHEGISVKISMLKQNSFICNFPENIKTKLYISNDTLFFYENGTKESFFKYDIYANEDMLNDRLLNKEIFSGEYTIIDSLNKKLIFQEDGTVTGFWNYKSFFIQYDYIDAGCNLDILYLRVEPIDRYEYTWQFKNDTLQIYKLDCIEYDSINKLCLETKKGKLIYRLLKIKD